MEWVACLQYGSAGPSSFGDTRGSPAAEWRPQNARVLTANHKFMGIGFRVWKLRMVDVICPQGGFECEGNNTRSCWRKRWVAQIQNSRQNIETLPGNYWCEIYFVNSNMENIVIAMRWCIIETFLCKYHVQWFLVWKRQSWAREHTQTLYCLFKRDCLLASPPKPHSLSGRGSVVKRIWRKSV